MTENTYLADLLRERTLKATSTRLKVLSVISDYKQAIPFSEIRNTLQNFDRVTLYRTIHILLENGIIHKAFVDEKDTYYAVCSHHCTSQTHNHKHIHFKCTVCEKVTCVESAVPMSISIPGFTINHVDIEATGVCSSCNS